MLLGVALIGAVAASGCIIETSDEWCRGATCYHTGDSCDFVNDMDCFNRTQAWWCAPDGFVYLVDCIYDVPSDGGCMGAATYAACGNIPPCRPDDHCVCSNNATVCGSTVTFPDTGCTGTVNCSL
jgi:hypothetical protein